MLDAIKKQKPLNEAQAVAASTLTAIMGRVAAYTGQLVRWKDLIDPDTGSPWYGLALSPNAQDFENGTVKLPAENIAPVPGR